MQTSLDDLGIVEHHQSAGWQMVGQIKEGVLAHLTVIVDQQLGMIALGQGELGNALVGQGVVIIRNVNVFCIHSELSVNIKTGLQDGIDERHHENTDDNVNIGQLIACGCVLRGNI